MREKGSGKSISKEKIENEILRVYFIYLFLVGSV